MKYSPYSISKIGTFQTCPKKFDFQYIQKPKIIKEPQLALERGVFMHEIMENNYNYNIDCKLNEVFTLKEKNKCINIIKDFQKSNIGTYIQDLLNNGMIVEGKFAIDKKLNFIDYWSKDVWLRGAYDGLYKDESECIVIDYKSGKDKSKDKDFGWEQGCLYSIIAFLKYPEVQEIKVKFIFLEHGTVKEIIFLKNKFNFYIKHFYEKTKKIENSKIFKENVSALCNFCDYKDSFCFAPKEMEQKTNSLMNTKISFT